jgi:hypothetical protein
MKWKQIGVYGFFIAVSKIRYEQNENKFLQFSFP